MNKFVFALAFVVTSSFASTVMASEPETSVIAPALGASEVLPEVVVKMREIEQGYENAAKTVDAPVDQNIPQHGEEPASARYLASSY
ncbi:hypothetical protein P886_2338 [Alteromonadaceae bacterium 2753L.S.0a.02]|nr:hypothetical protein P886_2338 [Alteromonadaceae bacterium 2753L.S.0a.02]